MLDFFPRELLKSFYQNTYQSETRTEERVHGWNKRNKNETQGSSLLIIRYSSHYTMNYKISHKNLLRYNTREMDNIYSMFYTGGKKNLMQILDSIHSLILLY